MRKQRYFVEWTKQKVKKLARLMLKGFFIFEKLALLVASCYM